MQYIHTSIHIYIKYNSIFTQLYCIYYYYYLKSWLGGLLSKLHLNCSDRKMLCISCEFLSWKVRQACSIYNTQISTLEKQSHVCTEFPTEMGCNYRRLASTAQAPEKQAKTHNSDMSKKVGKGVRNKELRRQTSLLFCFLLLLSYSETGHT